MLRRVAFADTDTFRYEYEVEEEPMTRGLVVLAESPPQPHIRTSTPYRHNRPKASSPLRRQLRQRRVYGLAKIYGLVTDYAAR